MEQQLKVDICCGSRKLEGFIGVDTLAIPGVDIVADLNKKFPFEDNAVEYLRAHDAIEHLVDKIHTMNEIFRVCKNGAIVDIKVPSTDGRGAFQDPTHVSYWNINSFLYYSSKDRSLPPIAKVYGFKGNFEIVSIRNIGGGLFVPGNVIYVEALLKVIK